MNRPHVIRPLVLVAALVIVPSLALAEVSVQFNGHGDFKRVVYLTGAHGRTYVVWGQMRPRLFPNTVLNPLGDNLGDLPPVIQLSPVTGLPWVVWPKNFGNLTQLVYSTWDASGKRWTDPRPIVAGMPLIWGDITPALAFDGFGTPYLVWARAEQTATVYFSTLMSGVWTPPLRVSDEGVDSRTPAITLDGTTAVITFRTPRGPVTKRFETGFLLDSAAKLMDNPVPPLEGPPAGPSGGGSDGFVKKK
ncbi:MAG TPA: hypothetical protein VGV60_08105 [Candidatus Polarisedimenticolia bacterium]|jgi:hypothetical protein|nr:hypothetical protein [Candidatus Polarisedimenticolia bacterium]